MEGRSADRGRTIRDRGELALDAFALELEGLDREAFRVASDDGVNVPTRLVVLGLLWTDEDVVRLRDAVSAYASHAG